MSECMRVLFAVCSLLCGVCCMSAVCTVCVRVRSHLRVECA